MPELLGNSYLLPAIVIVVLLLLLVLIMARRRRAAAPKAASAAAGASGSAPTKGKAPRVGRASGAASSPASGSVSGAASRPATASRNSYVTTSTPVRPDNGLGATATLTQAPPTPVATVPATGTRWLSDLAPSASANSTTASGLGIAASAAIAPAVAATAVATASAPAPGPAAKASAPAPAQAPAPIVAPAAAAVVPAVPGETSIVAPRRGASPAHDSAAHTKTGGAAPPLFDDPVRAVILDIIQGWGDLSQEDLKRLEMFRPEKVLAEADKVGLPKDRKAGEHASLRLARIRDHAAKLQAKNKPAETAPAPGEPVAEAASETAVEEAAAGAPALLRAVDALKTDAVDALEMDAPHGEASAEPAPSGTARVGQVPATDWLDAWNAMTGDHDVHAPSGVTEAEIVPLGAGEAQNNVMANVVAPLLADQTAVTLQSSEEPAVAPLSGDPGESSFWGAAMESWEIRGPEDRETSAAWPDERLVAREEPPDGDHGDMMFAKAAPAASEEHSLSSLHGKVKTADDLLALPTDQQADMMVFLEPAELSRVFEVSADSGVKMKVIDSLEHLGNPSALGVLRRCLDDPDPEIQLYALEAADRLLGVD